LLGWLRAMLTTRRCCMLAHLTLTWLGWTCNAQKLQGQPLVPVPKSLQARLRRLARVRGLCRSTIPRVRGPEHG
jgi:hypothetical protein